MSWRSRSPLGVEEHHAADGADAAPYPAAIGALRPEGHARDIALLDLQRRGSEPLAPARRRAPRRRRVAATRYPAAMVPLRPEGHARDAALLDLHRRGSEPLAPRVEEHHAAVSWLAAADIPRRCWPSGPKATLVTSPSLTSSGAGRSRSPRASKSTTPPPTAAISRGDLALRPEGHARDIALLDLHAVRVGAARPFASKSTTPPPSKSKPRYPAAMVPSGPKATLVTSPSLTSRAVRVGAARPWRRRAPRRRRRRRRRAKYPAAMVPSGPKATLVTSPSLTSSGAGRSRSPRGVEEHHAADVTAAVSRGDGAVRPEGHARDMALLDLQRAGAEPLPLGVEEHHAAATPPKPAYPAAMVPAGPKATLVTCPSLTSSVFVAEALPLRVEEHHAAAAAAAANIPRRWCRPARRPRS